MTISEAWLLAQVVCIEALDAGELACAKQALVLLLDAIAAGRGGDAMQVPGYEATVFLNLIKLIQVWLQLLTVCSY